MVVYPGGGGKEGEKGEKEGEKEGGKREEKEVQQHASEIRVKLQVLECKVSQHLMVTCQPKTNNTIHRSMHSL
jgi:hypothetical protein